jgi:hypothetical protein
MAMLLAMEHLCADCDPSVGAEPRVRQARLKAEAADFYPRLPVQRWTSAATLARLVAGWAREGRLDRLGGDRILRESDFEFRGGRNLIREALRSPAPH